MTQREIDRAAAAFRANPDPHHTIEPRPIHLNADQFDEPLWMSAVAVLIGAGLVVLMVWLL